MLRIRKLLSYLPLISLFIVIGLIFTCTDGRKALDNNGIKFLSKDNNTQISSTYDIYDGFDSQISSHTLGNSPSTSSLQNDKESEVYSHKIIASNVNMRNESNVSSKVITRLNMDEKINLISRSGDWSRVETSSGEVGWVNNDFVAAKDYDTSKEVKKPIPLGQQIANYTRKFIGIKYVWGGTSPKGFDCSGLVKYVYDNFGIYLERVAADQAKQGKRITRNNLMPGDLVFFDTDGGHNYINHVGIYLGNGDFIQASSGYDNGHKIVISDMSNGFYANAYMTARRLIN